MITNTAICINGLRLYGYHGVMNQERCVGNDYTVNIQVSLSACNGAVNDSIDDTVSYADIIACVKNIFNECQHSLLEHICQKISQALLNHFPQIISGAVEMAKIKPPISNIIVESASVSMQFKRN